jgi:hypothetical protein
LVFTLKTAWDVCSKMAWILGRCKGKRSNGVFVKKAIRGFTTVVVYSGSALLLSGSTGSANSAGGLIILKERRGCLRRPRTPCIWSNSKRGGCPCRTDTSGLWLCTCWGGAHLGNWCKFGDFCNRTGCGQARSIWGTARGWALGGETSRIWVSCP